jgi:hypothetical protein
MGGICSTHVRVETFYRIFWMENHKGRGYSEDVGVDGRIILKWILGK